MRLYLESTADVDIHVVHPLAVFDTGECIVYYLTR